MKDLGSGVTRQDALLTNDDLDAIDNTVYEAKERELTARTMVGLKTDIPEGAETYSYDKVTKKGAAKIFAYGADDVPLVDADIDRHHQGIYGIVVGFTIDIQEKRAAKMAGRPVETTKATAARRAISEKENDFFFSGSSEHKAEGLTNVTGIQTFSVPQNSGSTSTNWADKTGEEIVEDIRQAKKKVNLKPGMVADTLAIPDDQYEDLDKPFNSDNPQLTIRNYLQNQGWFDRIISVPELAGKGDGGTDCFMVYDSSPDVVEMGLPLDIYRHAPYNKENLSSQVNLEERTAGAIVRYPLGICRADGI